MRYNDGAYECDSEQEDDGSLDIVQCERCGGEFVSSLAHREPFEPVLCSSCWEAECE